MNEQFVVRFPSRRWLGLAVVLVTAVPLARATTFDVVKDFSDTLNPNGVWSYYYAGTPFSLSQSDPNCLGLGTLCWYNGQTIPTSIIIGQNTTGGTETSLTLSVPTGYVFLDPESQSATILFTAPVTGTYAIEGNFLGADTNQNSHPVEILANNSPVFTSTIATFGASAPFSLSELLNAGDHIAFEVLTGSTGCSYCNLTSGLQATITSAASPVPEPPSLLFTGMTIAAGMLLGRRRRRFYYAKLAS